MFSIFRVQLCFDSSCDCDYDDGGVAAVSRWWWHWRRPRCWWRWLNYDGNDDGIRPLHTNKYLMHINYFIFVDVVGELCRRWLFFFLYFYYIFSYILYYYFGFLFLFFFLVFYGALCVTHFCKCWMDEFARARVPYIKFPAWKRERQNGYKRYKKRRFLCELDDGSGSVDVNVTPSTPLFVIVAVDCIIIIIENTFIADRPVTGFLFFFFSFVFSILLFYLSSTRICSTRNLVFILFFVSPKTQTQIFDRQRRRRPNSHWAITITRGANEMTTIDRERENSRCGLCLFSRLKMFPAL